LNRITEALGVEEAERGIAGRGGNTALPTISFDFRWG